MLEWVKVIAPYIDFMACLWANCFVCFSETYTQTYWAIHQC